MSNLQWEIEYNTQKDDLLISEYGRLVQELLRKTNDIEEGEKRQLYVERVIRLMLQMQPQIKQQEDYKSRLWRHAFRIQPDMQVEVPEGIEVTPKADAESELLEYPSKPIPMRHYGNHVKQLIDEAVKMEDGPEKEYAIVTIAYYMKVAYSTWSDARNATEEMIRTDLYELSDRQLVLPPNVTLGSPGGKQPAQHDERKKKKKKGGYRNRRKNRRR
ncbi:MAG: DUF4290 domain-containing protein [Bacteroidota bacterium]